MKRRRLLLVSVVVLLIVLIGGGLYLMQLKRQSSHIDTLKPRGLAEVEAGDYAQAVRLLSGYLSKHPTDVQALRAFAEAQENMYERGGGHIKKAVDVRRRILELDPDDQATRRKLMEQYVKIGFAVEAIEQADWLIAQSPDDAQALRAKVQALAIKGDHAQALTIADHYTRLRPGDVQIHMLAVRVMHAGGAREQELLEHIADARFSEAADDEEIALQRQVLERIGAWDWNRSPQMRQELGGMASRHSQPDAFMSVLGFGYQLLGDLNRARESMKLAAEQAPDDAEQVERLATLMDRLGLFNEATALLSSAQQSIEDPQVERLYVGRLWERGEIQKLLQRAQGLDVSDPRLETETLGIYGLALVSAGQAERAKPFIEQLRGRGGDRLAASWASILRAMADKQTKPKQMEDLTATALVHHPQSPYFHFFHGQALAAQGKTEEALQAWQMAGQLAPAWDQPLTRMTQAFLSTDRSAMAVSVARATLLRSPDNLEANLLLLRGLTRKLGDLSDEQVQAMAPQVERFAQQLPEQTRHLVLPAHAAMQGRIGNTDAARQAIEQALASASPIDGSMLIQLAGISEQYDLGLTDRCFDVYRQAWGQTPQLALATAGLEATRHGADKAIETFDHAMRQAGPTDEPKTRAWRLARAQLIERIDGGQARRVWQKLIEDYPDDLEVLATAARSQHLWTDPQTARALVQALRDVVGEHSLLYRQSKAAGFVNDPEATQRELAEATSLLLDVTRDAPYQIEPHLLLARCFLRLGNQPRALELLNEAQGLAPRSIEIALQRAYLLQQTNEHDQAKRLMRDIEQMPGITTHHRLQLATLMLQQDQAPAAEKLLRDIVEQAPDEQEPKLRLALLLWDNNQPDQARELFEQLLERPNGRILAAAVSFYQAQGDQQAMERLTPQLDNHQDISPADRTALQVRLAMHQGQVDRALALLEQLAESGQASAQNWRQLIAIQIQRDQVDAALAAAHKAAQAHPDQPMFASFVEHGDLVRRAIERPQLNRLTAAMLVSGDARRTAIEALGLLLDAEQSNRTTAEVVVDLRTLADRQPTFLALQDLLMKLYWRMERRDDAARIAVRTMRVLPRSAEAAWMAANMLSAAGRWTEAEDAAWEYQRRRGQRTLASDMLIAESKLRLGQAGEVDDQLEPHLQVQQAAGVAAMLRQTRARALIEQGEHEKARQMLLPALGDSREARMAFILLAMRSFDDPGRIEQWFGDVERAIPDGEKQERLTLAGAWQEAGQRVGQPPLVRRANAMIAQLIDQGYREPQVY